MFEFDKPFYTTEEMVAMHLVPGSASHRGDLIRRGVLPEPRKRPGSNINLWTAEQARQLAERIIKGKEDPKVLASRRSQYRDLSEQMKERHQRGEFKRRPQRRRRRAKA